MFRNSGGVGRRGIPDGGTVTYHPWQRNATPRAAPAVKAELQVKMEIKVEGLNTGAGGALSAPAVPPAAAAALPAAESSATRGRASTRTRETTEAAGVVPTAVAAAPTAGATATPPMLQLSGDVKKAPAAVPSGTNTQPAATQVARVVLKLEGDKFDNRGRKESGFRPATYPPNAERTGARCDRLTATRCLLIRLLMS